jgi:HD-GYP domain-containing protein (c-di-GMP phosphodiesterase class II)
LNKAAGEYFDPAIVTNLPAIEDDYPMGKSVRLSNMESGVILCVNEKAAHPMSALSSRGQQFYQS